MSDERIEDRVARAARARHEPPAQLLEQITRTIETTVRPVRPLQSARRLTAALLALSAAVALAGAARVGWQGAMALGAGARLIIFAALALLAWLSARQLVAQWTPGSRVLLGNGSLVTITSVGMLLVFALLFDDFHTDHFLTAGLGCLRDGVVHAAVAALLAWALLRRGLVVNAVAAGLVAGVLAGLAGVTMLELHCSNFQALHVLVWHTLVIPVSAVLGAALGWLLVRARA